MDAAQLVVGAGIVIAVVAFVVWPMLSAGRKHAPRGASAVDDARIEGRVAEYREALRRGTVCARCLHANVGGARFCAECGSRLAATGTPAAT